MNTEQKQALLTYMETLLSQTKDRLKGNITDNQGNAYPKRKAFETIKKYIDDYYQTGTEPRWIVVPGLRGVGKTTLLTQLYFSVIRRENVQAVYISVDEAVRRFDATLWDIMEAYESITGERLEQLRYKLFFFLDEVQYDKTWDAAIKTFYDRSKNVYIVCTGSSAILLRKQLSVDSARRAYFMELTPMSFTEYVKIQKNKSISVKLQNSLKEALFDSTGTDEVLAKIHKIEPQINRYLSDIDQLEIDKYFKFGTVPFSLAIKDESVIVRQLRDVLSKIINEDLRYIEGFDNTTIKKAHALIYLLADSFEISLTKLSSTLAMSKDTLAVLLEALEKVGLVHRIAPFGAPYTQARKPYKYMFTTPAFRYLMQSDKESIRSFSVYKGKLLEDIVAMYALRIRDEDMHSSMTYDSASGGADFILNKGDENIVIEAGYGKKDINQVASTLKKTKGKYGLVVCGDLKASIAANTVKIPVRYWLLM